MTDDLLEFWRARLDEAGATMTKLLAEAKRVQEELKAPHVLGRYIPGWFYWPEVEKTAARVLREVQAARLLLMAYEDQESWLADVGDPDTAPASPEWTRGAVDALLAAVKVRASVYSDHPDYRPEWKP